MSAEPFVFEPLETRGELVPAAASPADRASEIVAAARAQAAQIESEARAEGYRAGRAEGLAAAEDERAATSAALGTVLAELQESRESYLAATERDVVELAVAIAEKIVGAALVADPELVCNLVAGALRAVEGGNGLVLEVNPDDVELVQRWLDASTLPLAARIELARSGGSPAAAASSARRRARSTRASASSSTVPRRCSATRWRRRRDPGAVESWLQFRHDGCDRTRGFPQPQERLF
jgi:hypothetical protein